MPKKKNRYEFRLSLVQKSSGRVLVEAESATKAKELLEKNWNDSDYLYTKITDCLDDQSLTISRARPVSDEQSRQFSYHAIIQ